MDRAGERLGDNVTSGLARVTQASRRLDWLALFLTAWVAPLALDGTRGLTYFTSLLFWLVPTLLLLPRFLQHTDAGGRRRRALALATLQIVVLGVVLDYVFGPRVLIFDDPQSYIGWIGPVPVEELFFYAMGPIAMLLLYAWCDEYWLARYNATSLRIEQARTAHLIHLSWRPVLLAVALTVLGFVLKHHWDPMGPTVPLYYTFLILSAFIPAFVCFESVKAFVNWQALGVTTLYVIVTSIVWEATLAIPRGWWRYQPPAMLGYFVGAWSSPLARFPIEASLVWVCAPLSSILTYELIKRFLYRRDPDKPTFVMTP